MGNHSILKVNLDGKVYYSDVTWDAGRYQANVERKYFLLSDIDISKDHNLMDEEHVVTSPSCTKEQQDKLLEFAQNRIKQVNEIEKQAAAIVENMSNNPMEENKNNSYSKGYIKICILSLLTLMISICLIVLGVLCVK